MTLKDRIAKLRRDNPLFTVAGLVEITLYGDQQERDQDFLAAAAQVLKCSQAEVDEAVAFTGEAAHFAAMARDEIALTESSLTPFDEEAAVAAGYHSPAFIQMFLGYLVARLPQLSGLQSAQLLDLFADFEAEMMKSTGVRP
jgi:hypothetical protein